MGKEVIEEALFRRMKRSNSGTYTECRNVQFLHRNAVRIRVLGSVPRPGHDSYQWRRRVKGYRDNPMKIQ